MVELYGCFLQLKTNWVSAYVALATLNVMEFFA